MELRRGSPVRYLALALIAMVAASCTSGSAPSPSTATTTSIVPPGSAVFANGGSITVAVPYLPTNFNPSTTAGSNRVTQMVMAQVWPQAFVIDPQFDALTTGFVDQAEVVGLTPMKVEYQIDPRATWSDGVPITAADFVYNWRQQLAHSTSTAFPGQYAGYRDISNVTGTNSGKTVTVTFKRQFSDWESLFSNLVPAHIAEAFGWASSFEGFNRATLVSGGPFLVSSEIPGHSLVLSRNPRYWGAPAHLAHIVLRVTTSTPATAAGLETGAISMAELPAGYEVASLLAASSSRGVVLSAATSPTSELWQVTFNLQDPQLSNATFRRALALDTDRNQLVANSAAFVDPGLPAAQSRLYALDQPGSLDEPAGGSPYDPAAAQGLWASLGYRPGADGLLRFGGTGPALSLTLTGPSGNGLVAQVEQQLVASWAAVGVRLEVHNVPLSRLVGSVLPEGRFQIAIVPYLVPVFPSFSATIYTDPVLPAVSSITAAHASRGLAGAGSLSLSSGTSGSWPWSVSTPTGTSPGAASIGVVTRNVSGLDNVQVGTRFLEVFGELNTAVQQSVIAKTDTLLWHELPTIPLFQQPVSLVQRADLVNVSESPTWAGPFWDAQDWAIQVSPPVTSTTPPTS